ncbi:3-isopropylmalate dehydratase large subunit [Catenibacterium mitsuokai]|uniref:3-isopropylmalate dehydratase large subunit n=1 Tax=Catenibacterium mitsuokai TaxID=100886 RepID=A0AAW4MSL6_9FIRM|nr:3-isopropylmalate dehydratase large subunit [Catenibacterium mitsuokai]MBV3367065.1 3-isopropylmalate dehydratase large subunit [Catenibacterium mitsuokai]MBV3371166.1 3-isopropylmalate dehydratase large subunit [Catenibacterium mitsuokai]MBV3376473.1 3-isopropylmalate dehydratase large subunit [Catenibacterium mitsuokai]MBV3378576.1 3-isopropylmalate dehydratase large subunit [Catenibacterium mitsuokai]MBV3380990.1 3-isopropylmalate dehydratase large subunit [Catenibacterium mitsuokai]
MGMTMTQKILADHAGVKEVHAGELIEANVDIVMANDITGPMALPIFKKMADKVFDKDKVVLVPDHFTPNKDIKSAENSKAIREFSREQGLTHHMEQGKCGVEHAILPESGIVVAGDAVIGADSHTCTYGAIGAFSTGVGTTDIATGMATGQLWFKVPSAIKFNLHGKLPKYVSGKDVILHIIGRIGVDGALYKSMEFTGEGVKELSMADRFTICNMAIEAGAKNGIFPVDEAAIEYLDKHAKREYKIYEADEDAEYEEVVDVDLSVIRPTVAFPHLPGNAKTVDEIEAMDKIYIDQVVIGSCTNGRMEDLRKAAAILKGKKVADNVRVMVIPATQKIYLQCILEGILETFVEAGCAVNTPSCGPCMGGHMGVLAKGEKCVSTTNRNFVGRMGDVESLIYLASPETAAASAIAGYIANPEKFGGNN